MLIESGALAKDGELYVCHFCDNIGKKKTTYATRQTIARHLIRSHDTKGICSGFEINGSYEI